MPKQKTLLYQSVCMYLVFLCNTEGTREVYRDSEIPRQRQARADTSAEPEREKDKERDKCRDRDRHVKAETKRMALTDTETETEAASEDRDRLRLHIEMESTLISRSPVLSHLEGNGNSRAMHITRRIGAVFAANNSLCDLHSDHAYEHVHVHPVFQCWGMCWPVLRIHILLHLLWCLNL